MTVRALRQARSRYQAKADVGLDVVRGAGDDPTTNMQPFRLVSYTPNSYRIRNGWPVATPAYDVRPPSVSLTGTATVSSDRPAPDQITTSATARWIAGINYGSSWTAAQGASYTLTSPQMPTAVADLPYRSGKEHIIRDAITFTSDLSQRLNSGGFSTADEFTVIMVMSINEAFNTEDDDTDEDEFAGLISPVTQAAWNPSLHVRNGALAIQTHPDKSFQSLRKVSLFKAKSLATPFYLSWAVGKPGCRVWWGSNPKNLVGFRVEYPFTDHDQSAAFRIGGDTAGTNYADMTLFDVGYYNSRLDRFAVAKEMKKLAKSYGGK